MENSIPFRTLVFVTLVKDSAYIIPTVFVELNKEENSNPAKNYIICQGPEICGFVEDYLLYSRTDDTPIEGLVTLGYVTQIADDIPEIQVLSLIGEYDG